MKNLAQFACILLIFIGAGLAHAGTILYTRDYDRRPELFTLNSATGAVAAVAAPTYNANTYAGGLACDAQTYSF